MFCFVNLRYEDCGETNYLIYLFKILHYLFLPFYWSKSQKNVISMK